MRYLNTHPIRVLAPLLAVAFTLFMLSGLGRFRYATGGVDAVVGEILWLGFLLFTTVFVAAGLYAVVRALLGRGVA